jgi:hypothetical protein
LKEELAALDLKELERRFGTNEDGDGTITITYRGRTTTLQTAVLGHESGRAQAQRLSHLLFLIDEGLSGSHARGQGKPGRVGAEPSR